MVELKRAASRLLEGIAIAQDESCVGAHTANGHIEGEVRRVAGQIRCLKVTAEFRYRALSTRQPLPVYAANSAAAPITRFGRGKDGRTTWEIARAKLYSRRLLFGKKMHVAKMVHLWCKGIFVGVFDTRRSEDSRGATRRWMQDQSMTHP